MKVRLSAGLNSTKVGLIELKPDQWQGSQEWGSPVFQPHPHSLKITDLFTAELTRQVLLENPLRADNPVKQKIEHTLTFQKWAEKFKV